MVIIADGAGIVDLRIPVSECGNNDQHGETRGKLEGKDGQILTEMNMRQSRDQDVEEMGGSSSYSSCFPQPAVLQITRDKSKMKNKMRRLATCWCSYRRQKMNDVYVPPGATLAVTSGWPS
jgi:hypothetical protein